MTSDSDPTTIHAEPVPDAAEFAAQREAWRESLGADESLRSRAVDLQIAADAHRFTYTWEWLGVPVIRVPDDIMVLQELVWHYRPERIVETGVARGGSLVLNASLQRLAGLEPQVLGIDIAIFPHTRDTLADHPHGHGISLAVGDSTAPAIAAAARDFLVGAERALLILDSNHTHDHVLAELRALAPLLPVGGRVLVADTLIEEFPPDHYANRPWGPGNSPASAVAQFLSEGDGWLLERAWSRRALVSEFRDGILRRVS